MNFEIISCDEVMDFMSYIYRLNGVLYETYGVVPYMKVWKDKIKLSFRHRHDTDYTIFTFKPDRIKFKGSRISKKSIRRKQRYKNYSYESAIDTKKKVFLHLTNVDNILGYILLKLDDKYIFVEGDNGFRIKNCKVFLSKDDDIGESIYNFTNEQLIELCKKNNGNMDYLRPYLEKGKAKFFN